MREWRHFEAGNAGRACVIADHRFLRQPFEAGVVTTGRQRVFHSYYVSIELPNGTRPIGQDRHNLVAALRALSVAVSTQGYRLIAVGLDRRFYETGLSHNSGYGYVEGNAEPFHMMDVSPYPRVDPDGNAYIESYPRSPLHQGPASQNHA